MTNGAGNMAAGGRRSKTSKGGNRGKGFAGDVGLMAIWPLQKGGWMGGAGVERDG